MSINKTITHSLSSLKFTANDIKDTVNRGKFLSLPCCGVLAGCQNGNILKSSLPRQF